LVAQATGKLRKEERDAGLALAYRRKHGIEKALSITSQGGQKGVSA
jgi:hypothetical protein